MSITRTQFSYDSLLPKFYGTRVSCSNGSCDLSDFYVIAQRIDMEVFEEGANNRHTVKGISQILGILRQRISREDDKFIDENTTPFDVTIHAYDPINDISYQAKVLGICMTKIEDRTEVYQRCHFIAHSVINWVKK
jgi:hypothetical protein